VTSGLSPDSHSSSNPQLLDEVEQAAMKAATRARSVAFLHAARPRQEASDTRAIGTGALDTNTLDRAEPAHPHRQQPVSIAGRAERLDPQQTAVHVDDRGDVHVAMRIDPTNDVTR
jgi:hypothetical protein